ncbi:hypothetical protein [Jiulongibacter sediminis]|uniref:hypothetical protein n=1 Tax=Jiulongibacter sediminis TaxID=1605367 RepID=UPI0026EBA337|nr:hypothetical protein [Jiulongibacter sediminis]
MKDLTQDYIPELHKDHVEWKKKLAFYDDELRIYKKQLADISAKNTSHDLKVMVEKFQNQFIIQKDEIDRLNHFINVNEDDLEKEVISNPVAIEHRKMDDDKTLRERMEIFAPLFEELKSEFQEFARKTF